MPTKRLATIRPPKLSPGPDNYGVVYFVKPAGSHLVKIGYTSGNLRQRAAAIATAFPNQLQILYAAQGPPRHERIYHRYFSADRVRGEWFRYTPEMRYFLQECCIESRDDGEITHLEMIHLTVFDPYDHSGCSDV